MCVFIYTNITATLSTLFTKSIDEYKNTQADMLSILTVTYFNHRHLIFVCSKGAHKYNQEYLKRFNYKFD